MFVGRFVLLDPANSCFGCAGRKMLNFLLYFLGRNISSSTSTENSARYAAKYYIFLIFMLNSLQDNLLYCTITQDLVRRTYVNVITYV
jgi:hypothetical protein